MYDIIAFDGVSTLTLNRPFTDPLTVMTAPDPAQKYMIYQPYIVAPVKGFGAGCPSSILQTLGGCSPVATGAKLGLTILSVRFANPSALLALGTDTRLNSSTAGWQRYELWPGPQSQFLYQAWYLWSGPDLVLPTDTLPYGIPESLVKARARYRCYEQAEANKDASNPRGAGADYRFLMGAADKQYGAELKQARLEDRDKCDIFAPPRCTDSGAVRLRSLITHQPAEYAPRWESDQWQTSSEQHFL